MEATLATVPRRSRWWKARRTMPFTARGGAGLAVHVVVGLVCLSIIFPFILMISGSLTQEVALNTYGASVVPAKFSAAAYDYVFKYPGALLTSYGVTAFITLVGTLGSLVLTIMLAYTMARKDYVGSRVTTFVVFFTLLFNGGLVPFFILMTRYLHLQNTVWSMIVPGLVAPFTVLILKGYMSRMNFDVIEAAKLDGASEFRILFKIVVPMAKPAIATLAVLISFAYWNEWFNALLFVDRPSLDPLQLFVYNLGTTLQVLQSNTEQAKLVLGLPSVADVPYVSAELALTLLAVLPFTIVFASLRRYFREGLTVGSLKG